MPVYLEAVPAPLAVPPALRAWPWLLLLLVALCVAAAVTVWLWPAGQRVDSPLFWACALGMPAVGWLFTLGAVLGLREYRQWRAASWNQRRELVLQVMTNHGQQPLWVMAHIANTALGLQAGPRLMAGEIAWQADDDETFDSRKFAALPDWGETGLDGQPLSSLQRLEQQLGHLLGQIQAPLTTLAALGPLHVRVVASLPEEESTELQACWQRVWGQRAPAASLHIQTSLTAGWLWEVDSWLDAADQAGGNMLWIACQLDDTKRDGSAEAVSLLLLHWPQLEQPAISRSKRAMPRPVGLLHRPVSATRQASTPLQTALHWGWVTTGESLSCWYSGLPETTKATISSDIANADIKLSAEQTCDLAQVIGDAGVAANALAMDCALSNAISSGQAQLLVTAGAESDVLFTVIRPLPAAEPAKQVR